MLKPAPDPAQGFLADAEVGGDLAQGNTFYYMRGLFHQLLISFSGSFKLCIYKPFFKPDIVFFIGDPDQSFYFMKAVEQVRERFF